MSDYKNTDLATDTIAETIKNIVEAGHAADLFVWKDPENGEMSVEVEISRLDKWVAKSRSVIHSPDDITQKTLSCFEHALSRVPYAMRAEDV